jgi:transposase-like protein
MPRAHPPEFRQRAVELARLREKPTREIAQDLGISDSCLRSWMHQADVEDGRRPAQLDLGWSGSIGASGDDRGCVAIGFAHESEPVGDAAA